MNDEFNPFEPGKKQSPNPAQNPNPANVLPQETPNVLPQQTQPTGRASGQIGARSAATTLSPERRKQLSELEIPGVVDRPLNNLSYSDDALLTKEKLSKEEKVSLFVQLDPGERKGAYRSVTINGYRVEVAKGKMHKLPKSVASLIMDAYQIEADTLNGAESNLQNADESKRKALGIVE